MNLRVHSLISSLLLALVTIAGCASRAASPKPVDAAYQGYTNVARNAFKQGNFQQAATLYDRSLMRARTIDDASAIADAAYNLSICLIAANDPGRVSSLLNEAEAELIRNKDAFSHVLILKAQLARKQHDYDAVTRITDRLIEAGATEHTSIPRLQAFLIRGHVACDQQLTDQAGDELQSAKVIAQSMRNDVVFAETAGLEARIESLSDRPLLAAELYVRQATLLQRSRLFGEMSIAQEHAGSQFKVAGQQGNAATYFYRSARSLAGQGHDARAARLLVEAADCAKSDKDFEFVHRIEALQKELRSKQAIQPLSSTTSEN